MSVPTLHVTDPFHSLISVCNKGQFLYIFIELHQLFNLHVIDKNEFWHGVYPTIARAILQKPLAQGSERLLKLLIFVLQHTARAGAYCHKIHEICARTFAAQSKSVITSYRPINWFIFCS